MRLIEELGYNSDQHHKLRLVGGILEVVEINTNNIIGKHDVYISSIGRREIPCTIVKEELSTMHGVVSVRLMPELGFIGNSHGKVVLFAKGPKGPKQNNYILTIQPGA